jgi:hypothetical protein
MSSVIRRIKLRKLKLNENLKKMIIEKHQEPRYQDRHGGVDGDGLIEARGDAERDAEREAKRDADGDADPTPAPTLTAPPTPTLEECEADDDKDVQVVLGERAPGPPWASTTTRARASSSAVSSARRVLK